jgi:hypothetical protein
MSTATRSTPTVEALIARCLTDPGFLESAIENPAALAGELRGPLRQEALQMDFRKLRRFSGFIGKVQHNYLWEHFPATRRLLWKLGIEHDVFGEYRKVQLSPLHGPLDRPARIRRFSEFLDSYTAGAMYRLLRCVFTHERFLWELRTTAGPGAGHAAASSSGETGLTWKEFQRLVPGLAPNVRVSSFDYDPVRAITLIAEETPQLRPMRRKPITLVYVLGADAAVRTLTLDPVSAMVFAVVTGRDSVRKLTARLRNTGFREIRPSAFRSVFEQAVTAGLMHWEARP